jgi:hypothetical protein
MVVPVCGPSGDDNDLGRPRVALLELGGDRLELVYDCTVSALEMPPHRTVIEPRVHLGGQRVGLLVEVPLDLNEGFAGQLGSGGRVGDIDDLQLSFVVAEQVRRPFESASGWLRPVVAHYDDERRVSATLLLPGGLLEAIRSEGSHDLLLPEGQLTH